MISISDNKTFWKTVKLIIANKKKTQKVILVENEELISENIRSVELFEDYFVNIVGELNIPNILLRIQVS